MFRHVLTSAAAGLIIPVKQTAGSSPSGATRSPP
jgi:hypothetical protein